MAFIASRVSGSRELAVSIALSGLPVSRQDGSGCTCGIACQTTSDALSDWWRAWVALWLDPFITLCVWCETLLGSRRQLYALMALCVCGCRPACLLAVNAHLSRLWLACLVAGGLHSQDEGNTLLKEDDSLLRHTFFSILRDHHPSIAAKVSSAVARSERQYCFLFSCWIRPSRKPQVDQIYSLSQRSATSNSTADFQVLERCLAELKPDERVLV